MLSHIHTHKSVCRHASTHTLTHRCPHTHKHTHTNDCTHAYTNKKTHTHTQIPIRHTQNAQAKMCPHKILVPLQFKTKHPTESYCSLHAIACSFFLFTIIALVFSIFFFRFLSSSIPVGDVHSDIYTFRHI